MRLQERVAQAEHAGLLPPGLDLPLLLGLVERDAAEDGEAIGVQARGLAAETPHESDLVRIKRRALERMRTFTDLSTLPLWNAT